MSHRSKEKGSDELLCTARSLVMVRNQLPAQVIKRNRPPKLYRPIEISFPESVRFKIESFFAQHFDKGHLKQNHGGRNEIERCPSASKLTSNRWFSWQTFWFSRHGRVARAIFECVRAYLVSVLRTWQSIRAIGDVWKRSRRKADSKPIPVACPWKRPLPVSPRVSSASSALSSIRTGGPWFTGSEGYRRINKLGPLNIQTSGLAPFAPEECLLLLCSGIFE